MTKYLITGAAGFIGSHLVDLLLQEGVSVEQLRLIVKPNESIQNLPKLPFDIRYADIRDRKKMFQAVSGCSVVYHLAAKIDFDGKTYEEYSDVNVVATQHLLDASVKHGVSKFIFFSSIGVYGLPAGVGNIDGYDESHPYTYSNHYGRSKWEGEECVRFAHKKYGLSYAIIRPASVYGPREKGPTLALYRAIAHGQFIQIGNGKNRMHYVYVEDLVRGARAAERSKIADVECILAGKEPTSFSDVVTSVAQSIQKKVPTTTIPVWIALCCAYVLECIGALFGVSVPLFPSRVRTMTTTYWYRIDRAKKLIGYKPRWTFARGTQVTGEWYKERGMLS